jgi:uncharacterized protein YcbX
MPDVIGQVIGLGRYPVKSMQGERPESVEFDATGVVGDRGWGVVDTSSGKVLSAKTVGDLLGGRSRTVGGEVVVTLPDGQEFAAGASGLDAALSAWLGREVALREATPGGGTPYEMTLDPLDEAAGDPVDIPTPPGRFLDLSPAHVLTTTSLASAAAAHPDGSWTPDRFRPTAVVELLGGTDAGGYPDNEWVGHNLALGEVVLSVFMAMIRCVVITRAQGPNRLDRDLDIFRTVRDENQSNLGVAAGVETPGTVRVGDPVSLA